MRSASLLSIALFLLASSAVNASPSTRSNTPTPEKKEAFQNYLKRAIPEVTTIMEAHTVLTKDIDACQDLPSKGSGALVKRYFHSRCFKLILYKISPSRLQKAHTQMVTALSKVGIKKAERRVIEQVTVSYSDKVIQFFSASTTETVGYTALKESLKCLSSPKRHKGCDPKDMQQSVKKFFDAKLNGLWEAHGEQLSRISRKRRADADTREFERKYTAGLQAVYSWSEEASLKWAKVSPSKQKK